MVDAANIDLIDLVAMANSGWTKKEIAAHFGVHRATIHRYEVELGIAPGMGGPYRKEFCGKGLHRMEGENAIEIRGGGRACKACKRERDRVWQKQKRLARDDQH